MARVLLLVFCGELCGMLTGGTEVEEANIYCRRRGLGSHHAFYVAAALKKLKPLHAAIMFFRNEILRRFCNTHFFPQQKSMVWELSPQVLFVSATE